MTVRADQLLQGNVPAHATAPVQAFLSKPLQHIFGLLRLLAIPKVKFAFEIQEYLNATVLLR
jgi:hypothetical protein